jgi:hypothetical protein
MAMNPRQTQNNIRQVVEETIRGAAEAGDEAAQRTAELRKQWLMRGGRQPPRPPTRRNPERTSEVWRSGVATDVGDIRANSRGSCPAPKRGVIDPQIKLFRLVARKSMRPPWLGSSTRWGSGKKSQALSQRVPDGLLNTKVE